MIPWWWAFLAFLGGALFGIFLIAIVSANRDK